MPTRHRFFPPGLLAAALLLAACDGPLLPHTIEPAPADEPLPQAPGEDAPIVGGHRIVVSFNSFASGTDPATEARFRELVAEFEREVGHPLPWSRGNWGREGEYDACLNLQYASQAQQADFARRLRAALEPGGRASIREYSHCGNFPTR